MKKEGSALSYATLCKITSIGRQTILFKNIQECRLFIDFRFSILQALTEGCY